MKKIYKVIICCIVCCSGVLWLLKVHFHAKSTPEVIKIYKAVPLNAELTHATPVERVETATADTFAKTEDSDKTQKGSEFLDDTELTPEEEIAFWKRLASLEAEPFTNTMEMEPETEDSKVPEYPVQQLTPWEEIQIIDEIFPLREIITAYGGNPRGNGVQCPLCSHPDDFYITREGTSWWCHTCSNDGAHDTFEFIARIEGMTRDEAHERLAEQAGLRK